MCEKAKEIQEKKFERGAVIVCILPHPTWYGHEDLHSVRLFECEGDWNAYTCSGMGDITAPHKPYSCNDKDHYIWLPRQDQLQGMLATSISRFIKPCFSKVNLSCTITRIFFLTLFTRGRKIPAKLTTGAETLCHSKLKTSRNCLKQTVSSR